MIYVIMYPGVSGGERNARRSTVVTAVAFVAGAAGAGVATGYALGWIGSMAAAPTRAAFGAAFGLAAAAIGASDVLGRRRLRVLQLDRETNQQWVRHQPVRGAFATGAVIGAGFATRIGFWLWYAIPVSCLLLANPVVAAGLYGTYATTRASIPVILWAAASALRVRDPQGEIRPYWLQERMMRATRPLPVRALTGVVLIVLGCAYAAT